MFSYHDLNGGFLPKTQIEFSSCFEIYTYSPTTKKVCMSLIGMAMGRAVRKPNCKNHPQTRPNPHWRSYRGASLWRDAPLNSARSRSYRVFFLAHRIYIYQMVN